MYYGNNKYIAKIVFIYGRYLTPATFEYQRTGMPSGLQKVLSIQTSL